MNIYKLFVANTYNEKVVNNKNVKNLWSLVAFTYIFTFIRQHKSIF